VTDINYSKETFDL